LEGNFSGIFFWENDFEFYFEALERTS